MRRALELIFWLALFVAIMCSALGLRYVINDARYPDAPTWTKFF